MAESAALLVDEVFPARPVRQWVLSVPWQLRFLFAHDPAVMSAALGVVNRCITSHLVGKAGLMHESARTGAVTLIQRFGGALNLNVHFHMLFLDGAYVERSDGTLRFRRIGAPTSAELDALTRTLAHRVFAPDSPYRARITPAGRGSGARRSSVDTSNPPTEDFERGSSSGWARRLARAFGIDVQTRSDCGGRLRIIACIEDRRTVDSILTHLERRGSTSSPTGTVHTGAEPTVSDLAVPIVSLRLPRKPLPGPDTAPAAAPPQRRPCPDTEPPHTSTRTELPDDPCARSRRAPAQRSHRPSCRTSGGCPSHTSNPRTKVFQGRSSPSTSRSRAR